MPDATTHQTQADSTCAAPVSADRRGHGRRGQQVDTPVKRIARGLGRRLVNLGAVEAEGFDLSAVDSADIAIYFSDYPAKLYQLRQWLPVFQERAASRTDPRQTMVVLRQVEAYKELKGQTTLPLILAPRFEDLMALYDRAGFHAVVYVNNGWTNFQSLAYQQAVHIHVNHGESDKICMVSNQAKAYDQVFVAGEAAVRRHEAAIAWFDLDHLVRVGRPQLDLQVASPLPAHDGPTIAYAPTWEGEDEANNYTSIDRYGPRIIDAALAQAGARVVYKPHPRIATSPQASVRGAHERILQALAAAQAASPAAGHQALLDADVLGVIRAADLMISDVSSVTLDHLYLRPASPIMLTDRRSDRDRLLQDAPIAAACHVIDDSTIDRLPADLAATIAADPHAAARGRLRDYYFDGLAPGQSTERFWAALDAAIEEHDRAMGDLSRLRIGTNLVTRTPEDA